nr:FdtA/QdtA family cupin domain-containing protein [Pontibacter ruber]
MSAAPYLLQFDRIGSPALGYIATTQYAENLPFKVKRVFWTYGTPEDVLRGQHANKATEEVLIAVTGSITVTADMGAGKEETFVLDTPTTGLYIPAMCWTRLSFAPGTIALCIASTDFDEEDYIREYATFKRLAGHIAL